jgi:hypothetical protein
MKLYHLKGNFDIVLLAPDTDSVWNVLCKGIPYSEDWAQVKEIKTLEELPEGHSANDIPYKVSHPEINPFATIKEYLKDE